MFQAKVTRDSHMCCMPAAVVYASRSIAACGMQPSQSAAPNHTCITKAMTGMLCCVSMALQGSVCVPMGDLLHVATSDGMPAVVTRVAEG